MNRALEITAVICNLLYTVLYLNNSNWCYLFGIIGPLMLAILCLKNQLYAEPVLQLVYIGFAIYGWFFAAGDWNIVRWEISNHLPYIGASIAIALISGLVLRKFTEAKLPFADSVVTVFGITGTWLMVNYVHENWLYFMMINALSIYIYLRRKLYVGAAMFLLYFVMAIDGYFELKIFY